ncbi:hypothetical protein D3C76_718380 [compost metagenome]
MLLPVLIHIIGFAGIDAMMGSNIIAADADLLGIWYAWFAFIDFIALRSFTKMSRPAMMAKGAILASMIWSLILVAEMVLLRDALQQSDQDIQLYIDVAIGLSLLWYAVDDTKSAMTLHKDA